MTASVIPLHANAPQTDNQDDRTFVFSKTTIRKNIENIDGPMEFRDEGCRGLILRKQTKDWVFGIKRKINSKVRRATIERWNGHNDIAAVRTDAERIMSNMKDGTHVSAKAKAVYTQKAEAKTSALANLATMTVADVVDLHAKVNPQLRDTTLESYRYAVADLQAGKAVQMSAVTPQILRDAYERVSTGKSPATANIMLRSVSALWRTWATEHPEDQEPQRNPVSAVTGKRRGVVKRVAPRNNALRPSERLSWYLDALGRRTTIGNALAFVFLTGLRRDEAFHLKWKEVDLEGCMITLPGQRMKSGVELVRPITTKMQLILEAQFDAKGSSAFVFPGTTGTGPLINGRKTLRLTNEATLAAGRRVTIHDLRRTYLAAAALAGIPDVAAKMLVGHSVTDITEAYQTALRSELNVFAERIEAELLGERA